MLRKLKFAEGACNAAAILSCIFMLLMFSGEPAADWMPIAALLLMIAFAVAAGRFRKQINKILLEKQQAMPINTTRATVVKSRVGYRYSGGGGKSGTVRSGPPMYYVTYDTKTRGRVEFYVPRDVYFAVKEGQQGKLQYKGEQFISFN